VPRVRAAYPGADLGGPVASEPTPGEGEAARQAIVAARMDVAGPVTAAELARLLRLPLVDVEIALSGEPSGSPK